MTTSSPRSGGRGRSPGPGATRRPRGTSAGEDSRRLAAEALIRIDAQGAFANLVLPPMLADSSLDERDRAFVTELVYGTTRMRRACDWLVDRFLPDPDRIDPAARAWLRLGGFQLAFLDTPAHAAVGATVGAAPRRLAGLCNAVLRRVADSLPVEWPSPGIRLSQPDWIVERLIADLGEDAAIDALEAMNRPARATVRADGYTQDLASTWVAEAVGARAGELVLDLCAAPGGKATAMASTGAIVVAADARRSRVELMKGNRARVGLSPEAMPILVADGTTAPFPDGAFDRVLLDAPCSGLGALRRRPDARWRISPGDVVRLAALQVGLLEDALRLVRPGGEVVYSVCTLTRAESCDLDDHLRRRHPTVEALDPPGSPWIPSGRGALLLPQAADTDGMYLLRLRRPFSEGVHTDRD